MNHQTGGLGRTAEAWAPALAGRAAPVAAFTASTTGMSVGAVLGLASCRQRRGCSQQELEPYARTAHGSTREGVSP
jgi:hypothetical protein